MLRALNFIFRFKCQSRYCWVSLCTSFCLLSAHRRPRWRFLWFPAFSCSPWWRSRARLFHRWLCSTFTTSTLSATEFRNGRPISFFISCRNGFSSKDLSRSNSTRKLTENVCKTTRSRSPPFRGRTQEGEVTIRSRHFSQAWLVRLVRRGYTFLINGCVYVR